MPKILLVEDNEMNRDMLSRRLARRGFDVVIAVDGQQGVELAARELPDIILMDMSLPVLDGWEASRVLKTGVATRSIPVIALTAHAMADDRNRAMEAGCDDYDTKPVDLARLLEKINRLLGGKPVVDRKTLPAEALAELRHNLKTAFNQILGYTEILQEDIESKDLHEIAPALEEIHAGARSLLERIQKSLADDERVTAGRLEALESELRPQVGRLLEACGSVTTVLRFAAKDALADAERMASAVQLLYSELQRMCGKSTEPAKTASRIETVTARVSGVAGAGAGRLLVVEDDEANRNLLERRLVRSGYAVEVAADGLAALEKISQAHYDLVLLDQMMPGMSGLDLLRLLRATYSASELPVIMVTALGESQDVVEALDQGANDYVAKPVDMPVVMARIQAQLARSKAERHTKLLDPLTGLSNRLLLSTRLSDAIARQSRSGTGCLAVLLLDLDGFKVVNDSFGHAVGDRLLIEVAERLKNAVGQCDLASRATIARMGGDEFVILVEGLDDANQAQTAAGAVLACVASSSPQNGSHVTITASIGIALCTGAVNAEDLLRDADLAMYHAKGLGKNRWQMFDSILHERARTRMSLATDLRDAVEREELRAVYQPLVQLQTGAILGFEVLLRWMHPERGLLPPSEFISVAEETGLIVPIGEWIIDQACRQLKAWQERFPMTPPLGMNVNLSVKQLRDPNLVIHIRRILAETGIPPESFHLELTESSALSEIESAKEILASIQALKIGLKLDDFGTGYSSLSYLRTLHFDSLKIDRSFIEQLATDPESYAIVRTIINLAETLRMSVVAEGIENQPQLGELIKLGCDSGQGFYFSPPLEATLAENLLAAALLEHATPSKEHERTATLAASIPE